MPLHLKLNAQPPFHPMLRTSEANGLKRNGERKRAKEIKQQHYAQTMKHRWYCVGTEKPQQKNTFHRGIFVAQ